MKHKWHDEIVAWAGGSEIEYSVGKEWNNAINPIWKESGIEYRIKPQPKEPNFLYVYNSRDGIEIMKNKYVGDHTYFYIGRIELKE